MPKRSSGSPPEKPDLAKLRFTEVTRQTRSDFAGLFEAPGGPKYCWCMAWRHSSREHVENDEKKRMMMALVEAGTPVGILAELDGKAVGWCSVRAAPDLPQAVAATGRWRDRHLVDRLLLCAEGVARRRACCGAA